MARINLKCLVTIAVILCGFSPAMAGYNGVLHELLLYRHPSARAEALGRAYVASNEAAFGSFSNPASLASAEGASLYWSRSRPLHTREDAAYTFIGGSFRLASIGTFGLSRYCLDYGAKSYGQNPEACLTTVTYSRPLWRDLLVGLNINRIHISSGMSEVEDATGLSSDIGLLQGFDLGSGNNHDHAVRAGLSLSNFTYSSLKHEDASDALPVILRLGLAYTLALPYRALPGNLSVLVLGVYGEYKAVLNSGFHKGFKVGGEIAILEVLALRLGHYGETLDDFGWEMNKDYIGQSTYGFGIRLPIDRITGWDVLLDMAFDMVRLDQPSYVTTPSELDKYSLYSISASWRY